MAAFSEIQIRKRIIKGWIDRVPHIPISLTRPTLASDGAGGFIEDSTEVLDEQYFGFMPFKRRLTIEHRRDNLIMGENETTDIHYVLIGIPGVHDIERGDYFNWVGDDLLKHGLYLVDFVQARNHDHLQAGIRYRGPG